MPAGVEIIEARISYLAYAPEIAAAMLQRQQAGAIIAARQKIVEGAVGMVEHALELLEQKNVIKLDGDSATCSANMQGTHVLANASGGPVWTVGGRHDYQLQRTADGWKIAGLTFTIQWATGNMHIITLAAAG